MKNTAILIISEYQLIKSYFILSGSPGRLKKTIIRCIET